MASFSFHSPDMQALVLSLTADVCFVKLNRAIESFRNIISQALP
jgi:hypothetical protein